MLVGWYAAVLIGDEEIMILSDDKELIRNGLCCAPACIANRNKLIVRRATKKICSLLITRQIFESEGGAAQTSGRCRSVSAGMAAPWRALPSGANATLARIDLGVMLPLSARETRLQLTASIAPVLDSVKPNFDISLTSAPCIKVRQ